VLTGRQKPLRDVAFLFAEIRTEAGLEGVGFSYSKRAGGVGQYAHAREVAPELLGEDPSDIQRIWTKLIWAGASVGRSGLATQAIAAFDIALWDLKAKRAGLPLAKLLGAHRDSVQCYNTSGGFLSSSIEEVIENAAQTAASGIGGVKIKVGQPDTKIDLKRVAAVKEAIGDRIDLMVDANQQWNRSTAVRMGRAFEEFDLTWIEEPLDAYDAEGHADLARELATPIATGEMLTSVAEHAELIRHRSADFIQPDAPRVGGITPFLKIMALGEAANLRMAPHYVMELHLHLAAAYEHDPWVEHFDWLEPLFNERLETEGGRMIVPARPGIGVSLSDQARAWTTATETFGA
jgi:L-alanine-DL-glutamate epimerase-like enolase superfamily enzyme